ncbi:MAG: ROK family protein, partial [Solirubrobacterales bacterium]|nr:ROK family protein [Solirubrobacterales bacterium]
IALQAVNLPLNNVPIRDLLSERLGLPVLVDNDANVAALAEHRFGAAEGARNAIMLTLGTGIGGGLIIDGQPYRGSSGGGAEIGHMVIDWDGPPCQGNCRNRGCIESLCSGTAIAKLGRELAAAHPESAIGRVAAGEGEIDGRALIDAALDGDEVATKGLHGVACKLGSGLSGLANIFEPDVIVLGGGVMAAGELLLGPARQWVRDHALPPQDETPIVAAELGPDAGMVGAAEMALETLEERE